LREGLKRINRVAGASWGSVFTRAKGVLADLSWQVQFVCRAKKGTGRSSRQWVWPGAAEAL
jgi:hypothetical protein